MKPVTLDGKTYTDHELICPECGEPMALKSSKYGLFYGCSAWAQTKCAGSHGAHPDGRPLGKPADKQTKLARMATHKVFDQLWKKGGMSRNQAYGWMQRTMGMTSKEAHIGRFDIPECKRLVKAVQTEFPHLVAEVRRSK